MPSTDTKYHIDKHSNLQQPQNFRNLLSTDKFELYQFPISVKHASLNMRFHLA